MADRTRNRLLSALKISGPQTAAALARRLQITPVAVRQHLDGMLGEGLVAYQDRKGRVGRPRREWALAMAGHRQFPDNHASLLVSLLKGVRDLDGEAGVERLIQHREGQIHATYSAALSKASGLAGKLKKLADLRSREGYMAEVRPDGAAFLLIENHCSICQAAEICPGFCRSELSLFRQVLGPTAMVDRVEHLLSGDRRCAYRISPSA